MVQGDCTGGAPNRVASQRPSGAQSRHPHCHTSWHRQDAQGIAKQYWWPHCREFVRQYVKGCAICQANKPITHRNNPPLNPITPQEDALPFQTIAVDFIVKLPTSGGYDTIMTITDHDCTKAVILVPCNEN